MIWVVSLQRKQTYFSSRNKTSDEPLFESQIRLISFLSLQLSLCLPSSSWLLSNNSFRLTSQLGRLGCLCLHLWRSRLNQWMSLSESMSLVKCCPSSKIQRIEARLSHESTNVLRDSIAVWWMTSMRFAPEKVSRHKTRSPKYTGNVPNNKWLHCMKISWD